MVRDWYPTAKYGILFRIPVPLAVLGQLQGCLHIQNEIAEYKRISWVYTDLLTSIRVFPRNPLIIRDSDACGEHDFLSLRSSCSQPGTPNMPASGHIR